MRFVSFRAGDYASFGALKDDGIVDVGKLAEGADARRRAARGRCCRARTELGAAREPSVALDEIRYLPTVPDPEKLICIGINYGNRNAEYKDAEPPPKYPSVFMRTPGQPRRPPRADPAAARIRAARLRGRDRARDRHGRPADRASATRGGTSRGCR